MKRFRLILFVLLFLALAGLGVLAVYADTAPEAQPLGNAIMDTYVRLDEADTPHNDVFLYLQRQQPTGQPCNLNYGVTFLKFNVPIGSDPRTWRLDVRQLLDGSFPIDVYSVATNDWDEATLTYTQAVAKGMIPSGAPLASANTQATAPATISFASTNLTNYIQTQRLTMDTVSLALAFGGTCGSFPDEMAFYSKENTDGQPPPLSVVLTSATAEAGNTKVTLAWATAGEPDNEGFNVYRSTDPAGEYVKLNDSLIPAQGSASSGSSYTFADDGLTNGVTYYYRIESVSTQGVPSTLAEMSATPRRAGKTR